MYGINHDEMVAPKVGEKLIIPLYCDKEGNEVKNVEDVFCMIEKINAMLTYPNYVPFADKTGCNPNQKKDRHIAGTEYITKTGTWVQRTSSTSK